MIKRPIHLTNRDAPVDRLSSLLQRFRVRARTFLVGGLRDQVTATHQEGALPHGPCTAGNATLHVVGGATVALGLSGQPPRVITGPLAAFYPRGARHEMTLVGDTPDSDGDDPALICAEIDMGGNGNPLARALPDEVVISVADDPTLTPLLGAMLAEAAAGRCGADAALDRLCEVVLISLFRHAIAHAPTDRVGLLTGLAHPGLSRALTAMHEDPAQAWTLEDLAAVAGMSRSAFAAAFHTTVGVPPATYLTQWRMTLAVRERAAGRPLRDIAPLVGYGGVAALSRALARHDNRPFDRRAPNHHINATSLGGADGRLRGSDDAGTTPGT